MATIYDVSELAGVSLATVSRVMNNADKVTAKTRLKVEAAMINGDQLFIVVGRKRGRREGKQGNYGNQSTMK